ETAFVDDAVRGGATYHYRVEGADGEDTAVVGYASAVTYPRPDAPPAAAIASAAGSPPAGRANVAIIPAPTPLPPDALLLGLMSDASYTDAFDTLYVVGEVRNDSNLDVGDIHVTVSFYDAAGTFIGETTGRTMLKTLSPGERSPFLLRLARPVGMSNYSIKAVGRPVPSYLRPQIVLVESRAFEDEAGFYHVAGTVKNTGSVSVPRVRVVVTLYGRDGGVVNVGFDDLSPVPLHPGELAPFDVTFTYFPKILRHAIAITGE
ncbi:MAG: hypothetical protein D6796_07675, partial [Caldilineae bacterium]